MYARASVPDITLPQYATVHHADDSTVPTSMAPPLKDYGRPKSSPSTFGPSVEIPWASSSNGLGIYSTPTAAPATPNSSGFPPAHFQAYPQPEDPFGLGTPGTTAPPGSATPEIRQPQPRRIAPNPMGSSVSGAAGKRKREDGSIDDEGFADRSSVAPAYPTTATLGSNVGAGSNSNKRRKRTPSVVPADLSEDDRFLVQLKEDEGLPWKDIAARFQVDKGQELNVAALQMRYKRLRERFRTWEEHDVKALKLAFEYWEKYKWEIISAKVCLLSVFSPMFAGFLLTSPSFADARLWRPRALAGSTLHPQVA